MSTKLLAQGPWLLQDIFAPDEAVFGKLGKFENEDGRCACCGHKIQWRASVLGPDGKQYWMGRSCASKLDGLSGSDKAETALNARVVDRVYTGKDWADFREWLGQQPHSQGWMGKSRLDDLRAVSASKRVAAILSAGREWDDAKAGFYDARAARVARESAVGARIDGKPGFRDWLTQQAHPLGWKSKSLLDGVLFHVIERADWTLLDEAEAVFVSGKSMPKLAKPRFKKGDLVMVDDVEHKVIWSGRSTHAAGIQVGVVPSGTPRAKARFLDEALVVAVQ